MSALDDGMEAAIITLAAAEKVGAEKERRRWVEALEKLIAEWKRHGIENARYCGEEIRDVIKELT